MCPRSGEWTQGLKVPLQGPARANQYQVTAQVIQIQVKNYHRNGSGSTLITEKYKNTKKNTKKTQKNIKKQIKHKKNTKKGYFGQKMKNGSKPAKSTILKHIYA